MKCIHNGIILLNGKQIKGKALLYNEKIIDVIEGTDIMSKQIEKIDAKGCYISPGFIDIHTHGYNGVDVMDGKEESIQTISKGIASNGVTAFLPTTVSSSYKRITRSIESVRKVMEANSKGADVLGIHMEGPFLNTEFKGAQNEKYIQPPDLKFVKEHQDVIRHITVAPEIEGATEFIEDIIKNTNISLAIGHTGATFEEAIESIKLGISHGTHLFNAMSSIHHRNPGVVGAILASDISCEIVCDNIHLHSGLYNLVSKAKGLDKLVLVTDCVSISGKEDGEYYLEGQKVIMKNESVRLKEGNLAGSILKLNDALRNIITYTDTPIEEAIKCVTINSATAINMQDIKGTLDIGKDADITIFDTDIKIKTTIVCGKTIYE